MQPVFAQIFAPRGFWILISLLTLLASVVVFGVRWHHDLPRRVSALFMAITLVATFAHVSVGWATVARRPPAHGGDPQQGLLWHRHHGDVPQQLQQWRRPVTIAKLANAVGADIVMLNENHGGHRQTSCPANGRSRQPDADVPICAQHAARAEKPNQTVLLVSVLLRHLPGGREITPQTSLGRIAVTPQTRDANFRDPPTLVAGHAYPPNLLHTGRCATR
ncbi:MAG: hypothetical protein U1U88_000910 [Lawsonella clevelandensis]